MMVLLDLNSLSYLAYLGWRPSQRGKSFFLTEIIHFPLESFIVFLFPISFHFNAIMSILNVYSLKHSSR